MKPTIAYAIHKYLGISETFIYSYLKNLKTHTPIVLTTETFNLDLYPFHPIYDSSSIERYSWWWFRDRLGYYLCLDKKEYFEHILYFKHILKKENVCLIHAHFGPEGVAMIPIKRWLKLPLITTFYGYDVTQLPREEVWNNAYQMLFKKGDLFLVEGNNMKQSLINIGCPAEKIKIQHIGIDIEKFQFRERTLSQNGEIVILFCGRFVEKKGLIYALKALNLLIKKHPQLNIKFRIIGDGVLRSSIESFIHENNLNQYVSLLGYQSHNIFAEELKKAHIYIQPSVTAQNGDSEGGAPTTLLEAQASGVPVIASLHADIPEVVINGKSGFLAPERDADALEAHLEYLVNHSEQWLSMGRAGRGHVETHYNIYKEAINLGNIYDALLFKH